MGTRPRGGGAGARARARRGERAGGGAAAEQCRPSAGRAGSAARPPGPLTLRREPRAPSHIGGPALPAPALGPPRPTPARTRRRLRGLFGRPPEERSSRAGRVEGRSARRREGEGRAGQPPKAAARARTEEEAPPGTRDCYSTCSRTVRIFIYAAIAFCTSPPASSHYIHLLSNNCQLA
uniref:Uncharacterized protein n=1 Tax=Ursus americanus TaxID=9643 RepID=A0A452S0E5_URSAM